jgi:hypothetical protein
MASANMTEKLRAALEELRAERVRIDAAIVELERLVNSLLGIRRRGRPPNSGKRGPGRPPSSASVHYEGKPKRKGWSPEARKAAAQRMSRYWAERRREKEGR